MIATYRLQLQPGFGFKEVEELVPYFSRLGISHLYLSPINEARPGSTHGYDVIDHEAIREDLGGREGFERLRETAAEAGLGLILDFVPNHAGVGAHNVTWQDVLAYGPHSSYAGYFDIDWAPLKPELQNKLLLPFLGRPYGEVLDDDELEVIYEDGRFFAGYYENRYALAPITYDVLLEEALSHYERQEVYWDLKDLHEAYAALAPEAREKAEALRPRLERLVDQIDLDQVLEAFHGERLHALLERQYWRLSYWKTAGYEINYRRFFDINELVALRMEERDVFWDAHRLLGELLAEEGVDGVRLDHIDGLFDPHEYLRRMHDLGADCVWVEKILASGETLPEGWPVEGTTGYEFMSDALGVLVHPDGELPLDRTFHRYVPDAPSWDDEVHRAKLLVIESMLSSELFRLAYELDRLSEADYHTRDFTLEALRAALAQVVAAFRRYRTYLPHTNETAEEVVHRAIYRARQRTPVAELSVYDFIARVILGEVADELEEEQRAWSGRFQQYTAPVAAKGVEDTAFYRYVRFVALNEVGGEPDEFGQSTQAFHAHNRFRARRYPRNLLATATHDHKRGEDTRMRLAVLSERTEAWDDVVHALAEIAADYRGSHGPAPVHEYLFFQVLAALWHPSPHGNDRDALPDRLWQYMEKAARESKLHTSWLNPDDGYEADLEAVVRGVVEDERTADVLDPFAAELARLGFQNTLSQTLIKFTAPGVPDVYQGCELLDLSLVDPDNRRPVDYDFRSQLLDELDELLESPTAESIRPLFEEQDPRAKFYLTRQLLRLRQRRPGLFEGEYHALDVEGEHAESFLAYARTDGDRSLIAVVPRFPDTRPDDVEAHVVLPESLAGRTWRDALTGATVDAGKHVDLSALSLPWGALVGDE